MTAIPTPILSAVPSDLETLRVMANRDVEAYERFVVAKRDELEVAERRLSYLRGTATYWTGLAVQDPVT